MWRKKIYKIVCRDAGNVYVRGRVSGMIHVLARQLEQKCFANVIDAGITTMRVEATKWRYRKIRNYLEKAYPGLCEFEEL